MNQPFLSIIIPLYNYADTLVRAVESVIQQSFNDVEIIIINDGSTDNSDQLAQSLVQKHPEIITYQSQNNAGPAKARNYGIRLAKGDFLTFLDADDELFENSLAVVEKALKNKEIKLLIGGHQSVDSKGKVKNKLAGVLPEGKRQALKAYLLDKTLSLSNGSVYFHKDIFVDYQFPEQFRNSEDVSVFAYAIANFKACVIEQPLAIVYKHKGSLRGNTDHAKKIGMSIVDEVFSPIRMQGDVQDLKKDFSAQRALSLFRTLYLAEEYKEALVYFRLALKIKPVVLIKWAYTQKAINALVRL